MSFNIKEKDVYIEVNDIFDELNEENKKLNNELMFANNCLNVLNKFKVLLSKIFVKYETTIDLEDKQEFNRFEEEFNSIIKSLDEFNITNVKTEDVFEIERNEENYRKSKSREESDRSGHTLQQNESLIQNDCIKTEEPNIFEIKDNDRNTTLSESNPQITEANNREVGAIHVNQTQYSSKKSSSLSLNINKSINRRISKLNSNSKPKDVLKRKLETTITLVPQNEGSDSTQKESTSAVQTLEQIEDEIIINEVTVRKNNLSEDLNSITFQISGDIRNGSHDKNKSKVEQIDYETDSNNDSDDTIVDTVPEFLDTDHKGMDESDHQKNVNLNEVKVKKRKRNIVFCHYVGCNQRCFDRSSLWQHIRRKHTFVKPFKCPDCEKKYYTISQLTDHQTIHSGHIFQCDICDKKFLKKSLLYSHRRKVHSNKPKPKKYLCNYCEFKTSKSQSLKRHTGSQHLIQGKPVKCDYEDCHKLFKDNHQMKEHKRGFHATQLIVCDWPECGRSFKFGQSYRLHKKTHLNIRKYRCDYEGCSQAFFRNDTMKKHRLRHEKNFVCDWKDCGKRFVNNKMLTQHMNSHLNIKLFKCTFYGCPKEYLAKEGLRNHIKTVHKNISEPEFF